MTPNVRDILINSAQGILGRFMNILLSTVFPYIVLGSLFGASAGGRSLIKLAFLWTRRLRGGPAHAAIISSAMFGTISGGPVVNVLSTGVLTIPMMIKRGFNKAFAGGVEAAASSGGQVMPPVMGVAAFVLAAVTAVAYSSVIVAAILPAIAYFGALFLSVVFQARKQNITAIGELEPDMLLNRADKINLLMIFGPILVILVILLTPKEGVSCGWLGNLFAIEQQFVNGACVSATLPWPLALFEAAAGDASSAGWWASLLLVILFFLDKSIRANPRKIVDALANAGVLVSTLYLMFLAVSIIDFSLNFTGLANYIANDVVQWMRQTALEMGGSGLFVFLALVSCRVHGPYVRVLLCRRLGNYPTRCHCRLRGSQYYQRGSNDHWVRGGTRRYCDVCDPVRICVLPGTTANQRGATGSKQWRRWFFTRLRRANSPRTAGVVVHQDCPGTVFAGQRAGTIRSPASWCFGAGTAFSVSAGHTNESAGSVHAFNCSRTDTRGLACKSCAPVAINSLVLN